MENRKLDLPADIGSSLEKLRQQAKLRQSEVAKGVQVDQSRISRIEKGEIIPDTVEVESYLEALNTDEAREYLNFLKEKWEVIPRPDFDHPDRQTLRQVEESLQRLESFCKAKEGKITAPLKAQIELYKQTMVNATDYLFNLEHDIAFIGDIGVGKTTAICYLSGLLMPEQGESALSKRVILDTGTGRMTICEVKIRQGKEKEYGIIIEPEPDSEIYVYVKELCSILRLDNYSEQLEREPHEIPTEIQRALRNMSGLTIKRKEKQEDGTTKNRDLAKELADQCATLDEFQSAFSARLQLWKRTRREISYMASSDLDGYKWLRKTYADINSGRHPEFSLPRRIDVIVPHTILDASPYRINIIDTKGIDGTAVRRDIRDRLDNTRTLSVLCSKYNDAPGNTTLGLLEYMSKSGLQEIINERLALLILPKWKEANETKDDTGKVVDTPEEGYEIKCDQVESVFVQRNFRVGPILFFNVCDDKPTITAERLLGKIQSMRRNYANRIVRISATIDDLIDNFSQMQIQATLREVKRRIMTCIAGVSSKLKSLNKKPVFYQELIDVIRNSHPRTVWAMVRRGGTWYNLDVFFWLGNGAIKEAIEKYNKPKSEINTVIEYMAGDPELRDAYIFLSGLQENISDWFIKSFIQKVRGVGEETYRPVLREAVSLWTGCENLYGQGPGFRDEVARRIKEWFEHTDRSEFHDRLEKHIDDAWEEEVIQKLLHLCESSEEKMEDKAYELSN